MTENLAGRGEGLAGLVARVLDEHRRVDGLDGRTCACGWQADKVNPKVYDWQHRLHVGEVISALEAAAPPSTAPTNEHELLVGGIVRAALELAILRGDLRMDSGDAFEEMSESEREDVITDTWNAMNGEGTCDDEPVKELTAIYVALGSPRKVGEGGAPEKYERTHSRVWINAWNAAIEECAKHLREGWSVANKDNGDDVMEVLMEELGGLMLPTPSIVGGPSSVPVGEQKQEEGV